MDIRTNEDRTYERRAFEIAVHLGIVIWLLGLFFVLIIQDAISHSDKTESIEASNDVSNIICSDETSAKALCIQAVDKLRSPNKDVSGIKCESTP